MSQVSTRKVFAQNPNVCYNIRVQKLTIVELKPSCSEAVKDVRLTECNMVYYRLQYFITLAWIWKQVAMG